MLFELIIICCFILVLILFQKRIMKIELIIDVIDSLFMLQCLLKPYQVIKCCYNTSILVFPKHCFCRYFQQV